MSDYAEPDRTDCDAYDTDLQAWRSQRDLVDGLQLVADES